jgi:hypothetical protein
MVSAMCDACEHAPGEKYSFMLKVQGLLKG